jgi:uncharacterized damage-inducible protein DinB
MNIIPADQFRRMFEYEQDAHRQTLDSLRRAEAAHPDNEDVGKAMELMTHIAVCRDMWLRRIRRQSPLPPTLFPADVTVGELEHEFVRVEVRWRDYLATVEDEELRRECEYVSYDGGTFRNSVHDILIQLFGHSLYHRGQIALLIRRSGAVPAATDFVFWSRSPTVAAAVD